MAKPVMVDAFCKAGGATRGYQEAGFYVVGVDIKPQPRYVGDEFIQADALEVLADRSFMTRFDAAAASPPCQGYSLTKSMNGKADQYPKLIRPVRERLQAAGLPYVIENVEPAASEMINPVMLCGTMFDLADGEYELRRHRMFEANFTLPAPGPCVHGGPVVCVFGGHAKDRRRRSFGVYGEGTREGSTGKSLGIAVGKRAMRIDWMTSGELSEAIPPAYTEYIGWHLMANLSGEAKVA